MYPSPLQTKVLFTTALLALSMLACAHPPTPQPYHKAASTSPANEKVSKAPAPSPSPSPSVKSLWDFSNPAATEARFLAIAQISSPQNRAIYLTQAARAQGLQNKFDEGHLTLDELLPSLGTFSPEVGLRYNLERGRLYNSAGKSGLAKPHFHEAAEVSKNSEFEYLAIDAVHMLGIVYEGEESIRYNLIGLEMATQSDDSKAQNWQGSLLNNLGWSYFELGQFEEALSTFQAGQAYREKKEQEVPTLLAIYSVAHALRALSRCSEALPTLEPAQKRWMAIGPRDGYTEAELALCQAQLGIESAPKTAQNALDLLSKDPWVLDNEKPLLEELSGVINK